MLKGRSGSEQSEVSETGRAGNQNWLKSRNSKGKIFFGNRKEKNAGNRNSDPPLVEGRIYIDVEKIFT